MLRMTLIILIAGLCLWPTMAADSAVLEKAHQLAKTGDFDGAIGVLKEHLKINNKDTGAYSLLARLQFYDGQADAGLATLEDGLKLTDDGDLLEIQARVYEQQGNEGPTVSHKRGMVSYSPSKDKAKEDAYKKERSEKALAAFRKLAQKRTDDASAAMKVAELLSLLERHNEALNAWEQGGKDFPEEPRFPLGQAQTLLKLKRGDEAVKLFQNALLLNPRLSEAHAALASYFEQNKQPEQAQQERRRAAFYEWLPPASTMKYSDANYATYEVLAPDRDAELTKEQSAAIYKKRTGEIERLMKDKSEESNEFLAALCFHHMDCGSREDEMFVELGKRGPATAPLLHRLLRKHQSTCTARGAALALATQKDPKVYDWLVWALPHDTRSVFHMDLATAIDVLGDPRAVKNLVEEMQPGRPLIDPAKAGDDDPMMEREGRAEARCRAALALGAFNTPESRAALQEGVKNNDFKLYCQAALYRMNPDAKIAGEIMERFKANSDDDRMALFLVRRYMERTKPEFAKTLPEEKREEENNIRIKKAKAE